MAEIYVTSSKMTSQLHTDMVDDCASALATMDLVRKRLKSTDAYIIDKALSRLQWILENSK